MSEYTLIRRCFISCRISSLNEVEQFVHKKSVQGVSDGRVHSVKRVVCAYNADTKDARIYLEIERIPEEVLISCMNEMGITSVNVDSFSYDDWRSGSANALASVCRSAEVSGFQLVRSDTGSYEVPIGSGAGNSAGVAVPFDPVDGLGGGGEEGGSSSSGQISDRSKRQRVASSVGGGGSGGIHVENLMVMDKVSTVVSSAIASAGSAVVLALASERDRREIAEKRLLELEMKQLMVEERGKYEAEIRVVELARKTLEDELKQMSLLKVTLSISMFSVLLCWSCGN
jgi:hypothetical protein